MDEATTETPQVRTIFEVLYDIFSSPANWEALLINFVAGLVILAITYWVVERYIDFRKEPARKKLFKRLVREALAMASCCDRVVSYTEEPTNVSAPVLNDRFQMNVELAYMSTIQFNEQLAMYSGTLDHRKVEQLSKISSVVSHLRLALNSIRQYDDRFVSRLEFYAPDDPNEEYSNISDESLISGVWFNKKSTKVLNEDHKIIDGLEDKGLDRDANWRLFFVHACHDILWGATQIIMHIEDFSSEFGFYFEEVEAELRGEDLSIVKLVEAKSRIEDKRRAIIEDGLYLVQYVIRPGTVTKKASS